MSGRHVFMGYMENPMATSEVLTSDGWLRSGDLGYLSEVRESASLNQLHLPWTTCGILKHLLSSLDLSSFSRLLLRLHVMSISKSDALSDQ